MIRDLDSLIRLQHLTDSALPIGALAHSFGLETLVAAGLLEVDTLEAFLIDYLAETGALETWFCRASCAPLSPADWVTLNLELGARKPARESREASMALGRRFLDLGANLLNLQPPRCQETHHATAFGFVAGALGVDEELAAASFLQQSMTTLISCCQRLLPLGQIRAQRILWSLKPGILEVARCSAPLSFTPMLDIASARHPKLSTRLFVS